MGNADVFLCLS